MSDVWGTLAQSSPAATTLTDAYTTPSLKRSTIEVVICNRDAAGTTVRLSYAIAGAANAVSQYMLYDYALGANASVSTTRFTTKASDVVRVYSTSGNVTFTVNGIEESV
jgi:hypothetical protein